VEPISYRPFDRRFLYNKTGFVDRQRGDLLRSWGQVNSALMCLPGGTGAGPAVWSHHLKPDQHAFRGSYGGWIYPLHDPTSEIGHFIDPRVVAALGEAYGAPVDPQQIYDAILALLSASSYTIRFAHDLEDDFPHIPFPAERACFDRAAAVGERIRTLQSLQREPQEAFRLARLEGNAEGGTLDVPTPAHAFRPDGQGRGAITLINGGNFLLSGVSERAWLFAVSGYQLLYKWLKARNGEPTHGAQGVTLLREMLDTVWRIEEFLSLADEADEVLAEGLALTLTCEELGLPLSNLAAAESVADDGSD
jgi:predicted helicase